MANLSEKFEEYLHTLPADEWTALVDRVGRARAQTAAPPPLGAPLANERRDDEPDPKKFTNAGLAEARRRGYIGDDGKPVTR